MESLERYLKYVPLVYAWVSGSWATSLIYAVSRERWVWTAIDASLMIAFAAFAIIATRKFL